MLSLVIDNNKATDFYNKIENKIFPRKTKTGKIYKDDVIKHNNLKKLNLSYDEIKEIVLCSSDNLFKDFNSKMKKIIPDFCWKEYEIYLKKEDEEKKKCKTYYDQIELIKNIFNYKNYIGNSYDLAELLEIHTCTYCNRNYVKTVGNNDEKTLRAEYDHFYNKSKYPLLALSFYNLIPICSSCNKKKLDKDFTISTHLNPYLLDEEEKKFSFSYYLKSLNKNGVKLKINTENNVTKDRIEKTFTDLNLLDVYDSNSDKELKDLLDLRYKYSKNYLDILCNKTFKGLNLSKEEAYRMIFGIEIKEEDYHKRPFSKFKHDIIEELKNIK